MDKLEFNRTEQGMNILKMQVFDIESNAGCYRDSDLGEQLSGQTSPLQFPFLLPALNNRLRLVRE